MGGSFSFRDWYSTNGAALNESRRDRYANDPDYRQRVLETNRESRRRKREVKKREPKKISRPSYIVADIEGRAETLFSISAAAKELGCSVQTMRLWERKGVIPPASFRSGEGPNARRVYTPGAIRDLKLRLQEQGRLRDDRSERTERLESCKVLFADGAQKLVELESAGSLARALGLSVSEINSLERQGVFPKTFLRSPKTNHRLYTNDMIRKTVEVYGSFQGKRGPTSTPEWHHFHAVVTKAWSRLKISTATLIHED